MTSQLTRLRTGRVLGVLFCLVALGAGGCGSQARSGAEGLQIYFYQRGYVAGGKSDAARLTDLALEGFARRHPEITVIPVGLPWTREGDFKLRAALLIREKIDCFRLAHDQLSDFISARGELLSPIDAYLSIEDREDISAGALAAVTRNGKIMAWPLWSTAMALIGNTSIMKERGIEPDASGRPWAWDEFLDLLGRGTYRGENGANVWGLTVAAQPPLFEWSPLLWAHAGPIFLPPLGDGGEAGLRLAPGLASALERVAELKSMRVVSPSFGTDDQYFAQQQFLDGRATFILSSPGFVRELARRDFPYVILPPPVGDYGKAITTGALGCFAVVNHEDDPERTAAAHTLARYLTSAQIAEDVPGWYLAIPVRKSVTSFRADPRYAGLMEIARTAVYMNPPGGGGFLEATLIPKLQGAMMGDIPAEQAIREILAAYDRLSLR